MGNDRTKVLVAAHCLGFGVYIPKAKKVLSTLAKSKAEPILAVENNAFSLRINGEKENGRNKNLHSER